MMVDGLQTLARRAHAQRAPHVSPSHGTPLEKLLTRLKMPVLLAVRASQLHFHAPADRDFISSRVVSSHAELDIALRNLVTMGYLCCAEDDTYTLANRGVAAVITIQDRRAA